MRSNKYRKKKIKDLQKNEFIAELGEEIPIIRKRENRVQKKKMVKEMKAQKPKRQKPTNLHFLNLLRLMLSPISAFLDLREFNADHKREETQNITPVLE